MILRMCVRARHVCERSQECAYNRVKARVIISGVGKGIEIREKEDACGCCNDDYDEIIYVLPS